MKKMLSKILISSAILCGLYGCSLITIQNPFADVNQLGTVVKLGESITIQGTNGPVTVEYAAPTKRRIIWDGESREISLLQSSELNGIYKDHAKLYSGPIGQIKDVEYVEHTVVLKSQADVNAFIKTSTEYGYEHRAREQMFVHLAVRKYFNFGIKSWSSKYLVVLIMKYEIDEKNGRSILAGGSPQEKGSPIK